MPPDRKKNEVLANRQTFSGGSDAWIIMGDDEAALLRLWREKRGEVEPEDLSGNLGTGAGKRPSPVGTSCYVSTRSFGAQVGSGCL